VVEDDVGIDGQAVGLEGGDRGLQLLPRAVLGRDRALLVELAEIEEVVDGEARGRERPGLGGEVPPQPPGRTSRADAGWRA
jgi:hypothetical protein